MAVNLVLNTFDPVTSFFVEDKKWCFGYFTFGASDTYVTGGFDITAIMKNRFGVSRVEVCHFGNGLSDGAGGTFVTTGEAYARYTYSTGKVQLYLVGKLGSPSGTTTVTAQPSGVEVANAASINAGRLDFFAICS